MYIEKVKSEKKERQVSKCVYTSVIAPRRPSCDGDEEKDSVFWKMLLQFLHASVLGQTTPLKTALGQTKQLPLEIKNSFLHDVHKHTRKLH